jgi:hypothetical protein
VSTYTPEVELQRRLVNLLRADATLTHTSTGLLFPATSPVQAGGVDFRVYSVSANLPGEATAISTLPRVLIEVWGYPVGHEQEGNELQAGLRVRSHSVVAQEDEELGALVDARIRTLFLSTWLTDARIITPRLVQDGNSSRERIEELGGAWDYVTGYMTPNAGSLL